MTDTGDGLCETPVGNDRGPGVDLGVLGDHRLVCPKVLGEEKKQGKSIICNNVHKRASHHINMK